MFAESRAVPDTYDTEVKRLLLLLCGTHVTTGSINKANTEPHSIVEPGAESERVSIFSSIERAQGPPLVLFVKIPSF